MGEGGGGGCGPLASIPDWCYLMLDANPSSEALINGGDFSSMDRESLQY